MNLLSTLAQRYVFGFQALWDAIARRAAKDRALTALLCLLHTRLRKTLLRLDRLTLRWQAGRLRPRAPARPRPKPATPRPPAARLPASQGWLAKMLAPDPGEILLHNGQILQLLEDPEVRALVAAAPQAGRLLRPLARAFNLPLPEYLRLPSRPRKPRPRKPRAPRPPSPGTLAKRFRHMTGAELAVWFCPIPPHFNLPIPGWRKIRRKIIAHLEAAGTRPQLFR